MIGTASVKVTLTVEIEVRGKWGDDCSLSQVYRQAEEAARGQIRNAVGRFGTIVGTPKIEAVVVCK